MVHCEGAHDPRRTAFGAHRTMSSLMQERDGNLTPHPAGEIGEGRERDQAPVREFLSFRQKHSWSKPNGIQRPVWATRCRTRRARVSRTPVGHLHPSVLSEPTCEPPCIGWLAFVHQASVRLSAPKAADNFLYGAVASCASAAAAIVVLFRSVLRETHNHRGAGTRQCTIDLLPVPLVPRRAHPVPLGAARSLG